MLFERQRRLLTLLDGVGGPVGHTDFQKLLFFYTRGCEATSSSNIVAIASGTRRIAPHLQRLHLLAISTPTWKLVGLGQLEEMKMRLQAETAAELDALLPAILDRAFKGEL